MSIVKISEELHNLARVRAKAMNRSINMQVEHWILIGKLVEEHPDLTYRDIWKILIAAAETEVSHVN